MGIYDRIKKTLEQPREAEKLNRAVAQEQTDPARQGNDEAQPSHSSSSPPQETRTEEQDHWLDKPAPRTSHIILFETGITKLSPDRLVWAPHFRYGDKRFCARLCDNSEASTERSITVWPIPEDNAVVEFICQEKLKTSQRLVLVKKSKLYPFWAEKSNDKPDNYDEEDLGAWNSRKKKEMRKALVSKHNRTDGEFIYNKILGVAEELLRLALERSVDVENEDGQMPTSRKKARRKSEVHSSGDEAEDRKPKQSRVMSEEQVRALAVEHAVVTLRIGDWISFVHKVFPDKKVYTQIIGFSGDKRKPLVLDSGDILTDADIIQLLDFDPTSSNRPVECKGVSVELDKALLERMDDSECGHPVSHESQSPLRAEDSKKRKRIPLRVKDANVKSSPLSVSKSRETETIISPVKPPVTPLKEGDRSESKPNAIKTYSKRSGDRI